MDFDQSRSYGWSSLEDSCQHRNDLDDAPYSQPRVRWSESLHQRFVNIISALGGVEIAKPKAIIERMHVDGLTTNHVKSHLQKYRKDLRSGRQLPLIPPPTEARSVHLGVSTFANGETSNMNRNNPTPPFPNEAGSSILTGETSNISRNTGSTPFFYSGAGALSWKEEASNMNRIKAASSLHLRPCASPGEGTSHMKRMKVGSLHPGAGTSAPIVETFDIGRIRATACPPHLSTGTSTGNVFPSNIIRQRNFNEAEAALRAQLKEQRLQLTLSQMEAQRQNPLLHFNI